MSVRTEAYAGVVSRGFAFLIDATTAALVATVGFQVAVAVLATFRVTDASFVGSGKAAAYAVSLPLVFVVYCAGWWTLMGRTPGMIIFGLRVVKRDGGPPRLGRSIIRAFGYWISSILMLGFIWIAFDRHRQGFHDKLAGTYVVYDEPLRASIKPVQVS